MGIKLSGIEVINGDLDEWIDKEIEDLAFEYYDPPLGPENKRWCQ